MKKSSTRPGLRLEHLEDRWVPTSYSFSGSNLTIYNITTPTLTVTQGAGNTFAVTGGPSFSLTGNLTIQQTNNLADNITVKVNATNGLLGNLSVTAGNSASTITVDGTAANGLVLGNTSLTLGTGGGTINLGTTNGLSDRGNLFLNANQNANNTLNIGNATNTSSFAGSNQTFSNFNNVTLGGGAADSFKGNITVSDPNNSHAGTVTLGKNASILGGFTITGGNASETVNINGAAVNGALTLNLKDGPNALVFGSGGATSINSLSYTSLNGNTSFTANGAVGTAVTIQNNAQFNWGSGANSFGSSVGLTVNSAFTVTNGNGGLNVSTNTFRGTVLGTLAVNPGNGNNSFYLDGTNGANVATFNYGNNQSNGGNSITIDDSANAQVISLGVYFGTSGANLFTIAGGTTAQLTGTISWAIPSLFVAGVNGLAGSPPYVFTLPINIINQPA